MATIEAKDNVVSALSAEAKSFIPGRLKSDQGNIPQAVAPELPKYMTNCYPFVKPDSQPNNYGPGNNQQTYFHPRSSVARSSYNIGSVGTHSNPQMSPRIPGGHSMHRPPDPYAGLHVHTQNSMAQPPPMFSPMHMTYPPPPLGVPRQPFMTHQYQVPHLPLSPQAWMQVPQSRAPYSQGQSSNHIHYAVPQQGSYQQSYYKHPAKHKKKRNGGDWDNMVSFGIQNETHTHPGGLTNTEVTATTNTKKTRPKTIMCMDAAMQTDFNDEIAKKTLLERPSCLYQPERANRAWEVQESTTDSEVDSDSGYCSPMHRRNQASGMCMTTLLGLPLPPPTAPGNMGPIAVYPPHAAGPVPSPPVFYGYAHAVYANPARPQPPPTHPPHVRPPYPGAYNHHVDSQPDLRPVRPNKRENFSRNRAPAPEQSSYPMQGQQNRVTAPRVNYSAALKSGCPSPNRRIDNSPAKENRMQHNPAYSATKEQRSSQRQETVSNNASSDRGRVKTQQKENETADSTGAGSKPKRKRSRRRRRKGDGTSTDRQSAHSDGHSGDGLVRTHSSSNVSRTSTVENEILHFEDEDEFPNLLSAVGGLQGDSASSHALVSASYCDILKGQAPHLSQESAHSYSSGGYKSYGDMAGGAGGSRGESKNMRKKRKRRDAVEQAAEHELAEITLEQQVLRQLSAKSQQQQQQKSGKRSTQPIAFNIADMITALETQGKQPQQHITHGTQPYQLRPQRRDVLKVANMLDSSAPVKRGKEREVPKAKKPSPLKKVILKEREEKKRLRLLEDGVAVDVSDDVTGVHLEDSMLSGTDENRDFSQEGGGRSQDLQADASMSPISQTSPISMSPLSGSPLQSGFTSPIAQAQPGATAASVLQRLHSRRFREYCTQMLDKDIDQCCTALLQELVRFQDRLYHRDPNKAKSKRRFVLGLREVTKHLKVKKIKCVMISPNLERIQSKGGLDEALTNIIKIAQEQTVPIVFALGRRALGRACAKLVPVSVVGIFSYDGCEEYFKRLMDMTKKARDSYTEMVNMMEKELMEQRTAMANMAANQTSANMAATPTSGPAPTFADVPRFFSHMGHSRTPSGCSGISLTSSILSEPISENYPYSEPETDSRGYEIVREAAPAGSGETLEEKLQKIESDLREIKEQEDVAKQTGASGQRKEEDGEENEEEDGEDYDEEEKVCIVENLEEFDAGNEADTEDDVVRRGCLEQGGNEREQGTAAASPLPPFDSIHAPLNKKATDIAASERDNILMSPLDSGHLQTPAKDSNNERIEEWVARTQQQVERLGLQESEVSDSADNPNSEKPEMGDNISADEEGEESEHESVCVKDSESESENGGEESCVKQ